MLGLALGCLGVVGFWSGLFAASGVSVGVDLSSVFNVRSLSLFGVESLVGLGSSDALL